MKPLVKMRLTEVEFFEQGLKRAMHVELNALTRKRIRKYDEELCGRVLEDVRSLFRDMILDATNEGLLTVQNILVDKVKSAAEDLKAVFSDEELKINTVNHDLFNNTLYISVDAKLSFKDKGEVDYVYNQYGLLIDVYYGVSTNGVNFIPVQQDIVSTKTLQSEKTNFQSVQYLKEDIQPMLGLLIGDLLNEDATKKLVTLTPSDKSEEALKSVWVENNIRESYILEEYVPQINGLDVIRPLRVKDDILNCSWDMQDYQSEHFKICVPVTAKDFIALGHNYKRKNLELDTDKLLQFVHKYTKRLKEQGKDSLLTRVSMLCKDTSELNRLTTSSFLNMGTGSNSTIDVLKKDWSDFSNVFDSDFGMDVPLALVYYTVTAEVNDYNEPKNIKLHPYMMVTEI